MSARLHIAIATGILVGWPGPAGRPDTPPFIADPLQMLERTCFQVAVPWNERINLRSDVAIVYGIDPSLPGRIQTWRDRGYRIHVMTGVSWGHYQDYLYGRFDGVDRQDEAQTDRHGGKISHGGDVYYMCPGENFGRFLCVGVQRALDAGIEAIHLEEPEFWARAGYSAGFQREWRAYYGVEWEPPHESLEARWRASKLKYFLYRRALQQVFDHVQEHNRRTGQSVRCHVPTHSLLNYAHWRIVSPASSLARLDGCDGYIAQVWTGTARTPNVYRGNLRERTFETAFLEYGAMQNLVRATGRRVWYLNDPVEDNPGHDWADYRRNWRSTLVASLFQPEVWRFEVMPWPDRVFTGRYPKADNPDEREGIPPDYATELQIVINALNHLNQPDIAWDCGTQGIGVVVSDSLMFQREAPHASDPHLSHVYGLALPFLKRGMPVTPVQLENVILPGYLDGFRLLLLSYQGQKPLTPAVHPPLADWVREGGMLAVWDDDSDPYLGVGEWWNRDEPAFGTPREHLFEALGLDRNTLPGVHRVGAGRVLYRAQNPVDLARAPDGDRVLIAAIREALKDDGGTAAPSTPAPAGLAWRETNHLVLRRGPYVIAAGLDESGPQPVRRLEGRWVNLFDAALPIETSIDLTPGSRHFLLDVERAAPVGPAILAAAGKALPLEAGLSGFTCLIEGVAETQAVVLLRLPDRPGSVTLDGLTLEGWRFDDAMRLLWVSFPNQARARRLAVSY